MPLFETPTEPTKPPALEHHDPAPPPVRIVAGKHGEMDAHELVRLLDTFEDERARGRFRESLYVSMFVWIALAWFFTYGLHMMWHPATLKTTDMHQKAELTNLNMPVEPVHTPAVRPAPRPTIDNATMERVREMTRREVAEAAKPAVPAPTPTAAPPPPPPVVANTPQPRTPPPVVADAPTMQPSRPNFGTPTSAGSAIRGALNDAAREGRGGDYGNGRPSRHSGPLNLGGAEVLSDTQGVDFGPYLRRILGDIKRNWDPLIPAEAEPPLSKQGETYIRFSINPDGTIAAMHLDGSTHDEAINRSCWGSITSEGQFPPLPKEFHGPNLELRIHYLVNKDLPQ